MGAERGHDNHFPRKINRWKRRHGRLTKIYLTPDRLPCHDVPHNKTRWLIETAIKGEGVGFSAQPDQLDTGANRLRYIGARATDTNCDNGNTEYSNKAVHPPSLSYETEQYAGRSNALVQLRAILLSLHTTERLGRDRLLQRSLDSALASTRIMEAIEADGSR